MRSKSDHAWRMAAQCAKLAQNADEKDEREFYIRMRDSWITVANRYEFLEVIDEQGALIERPRSPAGQYIPHPLSRSHGDEDRLRATDGEAAAAKPWVPAGVHPRGRGE